MSMTNNIYTGIFGAIGATPSISGLTLSRDEAVGNANPDMNGDIYIAVKGGTIQMGLGWHFERYTIKTVVSSRGNSSYDNACNVCDTIRGAIEGCSLTVSGADVVQCRCQRLPTQSVSRPIDGVSMEHLLELQVTP